MIAIEEVRLPAYWASYLVNGDASGLDDSEIKKVKAWQRENPHLSVVSCQDDQGIGVFDGLLVDLLTFEAHVFKEQLRTSNDSP